MKVAFLFPMITVARLNGGFGRGDVLLALAGSGAVRCLDGDGVGQRGASLSPSASTRGISECNIAAFTSFTTT